MFCSKCGDPVEPGEKFCNKCGNPTHNNLVVNSQKSNSLNKIFLGIGIVIFCFLILFLIVFLINKNVYYFNDDPYKQNDGYILPSESSPKKGKYKTIIVYDNTYSGVTINNETDAYNLIVKDSLTQKDNCPIEIKKVEDEIINNYGITAVNLCEMDVDFAKEISKVLQKIYNEYPSIRGYITNLTLVNASITESYIAAFMPAFTFATSDSFSTYPWVMKTQILLNTSYFLNQSRLKEQVTNGSNSGHFPKNATIYSPVAHEMGHYLSFLAMMKSYYLNSILLVDSDIEEKFYDLVNDFSNGDFSLSMIKEAYENYKRDTNDTIALDAWRETISAYAVAKDNSGEYIYDETIAESFHDVYLNGEKACQASKYIVDVLKGKLGA